MKCLKKNMSSESVSDLWCSDHKGKHYTFEEFIKIVHSFHGYSDPGVIIAGRMVEVSKSHFSPKILTHSISETNHCIPDAIQLLTLCTIGNGLLNIIDLGRYALIFYDKYKKNGFRVSVNCQSIEKWPHIADWFFKRKPRELQNTEELFKQIQHAGNSLFKIDPVIVSPEFPEKKEKGKPVICPICKEAYPAKHGSVCRGCSEDIPLHMIASKVEQTAFEPLLKKVPTLEAIGYKALHDMTRVIPGKEKGPAISHGETISASDLCRLGRMGRNFIYVKEEEGPGENWVHENDAASSLAKKMAGTGNGIFFEEPPKEGKITLKASRDGLFVLDEERLYAFNLIENVMCATCQNGSVVSKGRSVAGTRSIPLYISRQNLSKALSILEDGPIFSVLPLRKLRTGIVITGTEVFKGLIQDAFYPIIEAKILNLGGSIVDSKIVPDSSSKIQEAILNLIQNGSELIILTGGLSVDPDDVTRKGVLEAGGVNLIYGMPVLPGAMTLIASIKEVKIIGVPACALYFKTTSLDLLLPRIFAGLTLSRKNLARMGNGGLCLHCSTCSYPQCSFGK